MPSREVQSRLKKDLVVWLVTAGADARPQAVPVWFIWEKDSFLIYAAPGVKVKHVRANPNVELHLNTDEAGEVVIRASGKAKVVRTERPANKVPAYVRKYRQEIKGFGWTPAVFAQKYPHPIRVREVRFH